jgi:hypothetical protein
MSAKLDLDSTSLRTRYYWEGDKSISGTLQHNGSGVALTVLLFEQETRRWLVRKVSSAADGSYVFSNLAAGWTFDVCIQGPTGFNDSWLRDMPTGP